MAFFHDAWKAMDAFGQEAGKNVGPALEEAWKNIDAFDQEAGKHIAIATEHTKNWIEEHLGETAGIVACVLAAPVGAAIMGGVTHMVGFTATTPGLTKAIQDGKEEVIVEDVQYVVHKGEQVDDLAQYGEKKGA